MTAPKTPVPVPWYTSVPTWTSIVQVIAGALVAIGVLDSETGADIVARWPDIIVGGIVAMVGAVQFWWYRT